jgi:hypothetical protein
MKRRAGPFGGKGYVLAFGTEILKMGLATFFRRTAGALGFNERVATPASHDNTCREGEKAMPMGIL